MHVDACKAQELVEKKYDIFYILMFMTTIRDLERRLLDAKTLKWARSRGSIATATGPQGATKVFSSAFAKSRFQTISNFSIAYNSFCWS